VSDVDDFEDWKYEHDDDPGEPDCWCTWTETCWSCSLPPARIRRRWARRTRQQQRRWRKAIRHNNDRFWQARNRPAFDDETPF
jgi:hypothetical protein